MLKRTLCTILAAAMLFGLQALSAEYTIKFGHPNTELSDYHLGIVKFKELIEERSGGKVAVKVFPNAQLGNPRQMIEGLQMGTLEACLVPTSILGNFIPEFNVLDAPFLFRDYDHVYKVLDGEIGQELDDKLLKKQNCRSMGYWDVGFRHIFSSRPIRVVDDLKGLKIRSMESKLNMALFSRMGCLPTPMAVNELFTALQQKTVDAAENAIQFVYYQKLYDVTPYITLTGHFYDRCIIMIGEDYYQSLPADIKQLVMDTAKDATAYQHELAHRLEAEMRVRLEKEFGVEFIENIDRAKLAEMVMPLYDEYPDMLPPDLVKRIRDTE